jgi:hypothetical protein
MKSHRVKTGFPMRTSFLLRIIWTWMMSLSWWRPSSQHSTNKMLSYWSPRGQPSKTATMEDESSATVEDAMDFPAPNAPECAVSSSSVPEESRRHTQPTTMEDASSDTVQDAVGFPAPNAPENTHLLVPQRLCDRVGNLHVGCCRRSMASPFLAGDTSAMCCLYAVCFCLRPRFLLMLDGIVGATAAQRRFKAYKVAHRMLYGNGQRGVRRQLPNCVLVAIREWSPSPYFTGHNN